MTDLVAEESPTVATQLAAQGYWPALAAEFLSDMKLSKAVEICREHLADEPDLISGRLIYGKALFLADQVESASEQFYHVLSLDPDNLVALKYLADIRFAAGDEPAAMACYRRVLEIDPASRGLRSDLKFRQKESTHTIALKRGQETTSPIRTQPVREIPFYTETIGDLYLAQGYARLAADVFQNLTAHNDNPRLIEKLRQAEQKIREKEH